MTIKAASSCFFFNSSPEKFFPLSIMGGGNSEIEKRTAEMLTKINANEGVIIPISTEKKEHVTWLWD